METIKDLVQKLYTDCLTVNTRSDPAEVMGRLLADDFVSQGSVDAKGKPQFTGQVQFFWKLIPDLAWTPQEILQDGDRVIVRSIATGTPNGDFMGTPTNGSRSFKIMSIDIHTVVNGRIQKVHHVEDWATAMKQLRG